MATARALRSKHCLKSECLVEQLVCCFECGLYASNVDYFYLLENLDFLAWLSHTVLYCIIPTSV